MTDELLDIVNDDDIVTGQAPRSTIHQHGLQHRGAHVFLFTPEGKMLIQKRSADRTSAPSLLDCSVSEHVKAGESYLEAARRGMQEEMGVTVEELIPLVKFKMVYGPNDNEISTLYKGIVHPASVKFDPVEIAEIRYLSMDELRSVLENEKQTLCGWFVEILHWYWGHPAAMTILKTWP